MCGRYNLKSGGAEIAAAFDALWDGSYEPNYNIAPTTTQPVIRFDEERRRKMSLLRWGLVPFWAKDEKIGARMINARSETVAEKPAFRAAYKARRCVVPASGYFEWSAIDGKKQPYNIVPVDRPFFGFAGLWERWSPDAETTLETFTILTCAANEEMSELHHRMPVILEPDDFDTWLSTNEDSTSGLESLFPAVPASTVEVFPVPREVGNVRNNDETLTEPIVLGGQGTLEL